MMKGLILAALAALVAVSNVYADATPYECPPKVDATVSEKSPEKLAGEWKAVGGGERPLSGLLHESILNFRGVQGGTLRCTYKGLRLSLVREIPRGCANKKSGPWKPTPGTEKDATCSGSAKCAVQC